MVNYLALNSDGSQQEVAAILSSGGVSDANKIPGTGSDGKFHISFMPTGIGADTVSVVASESLSDGDFVNIYNNNGAANVRKAFGIDNTKSADGFVLSAYAQSDVAIVYLRGINSHIAIGAFTIADLNKQAMLSAATPGTVTITAPSTTGNICQVLGRIEAVGVSTITVNFSRQTYTVRA